MNHPILILLNGFAASGKTTLAKRYLDDHPLTLAVEGDMLIVMLGRWREHAREAEELKLSLEESLVTAQLRSGHDVLLPILPQDVFLAEKYKAIAHEAKADFVEVLLDLNREEAIARLLKRGVWGEEGLPPLTEFDRPRIEKKYDQMIVAVNQRENTVRIYPKEGEIEETYAALMMAVKKVAKPI